MVYVMGQLIAMCNSHGNILEVQQFVPYVIVKMVVADMSLHGGQTETKFPFLTSLVSLGLSLSKCWRVCRGVTSILEVG